MKINDLLEIKIIQIKRNSIIFTTKTHIWCKLPYPNHPIGCPNYNKNSLCPPNVQIMEKMLKEYNFFYLIYVNFNLLEYKNHMLEKHPDWSERKASCLLYWHGSVKKYLK